MGKRGPKARKIVSEEWSPQLAYAIGLLATDGCLSPPGHLINLTSIDKEQIENFCSCIGLQLHIGRKSSAASKQKKYLCVQLKNVFFYDFLVRVGLTPAKSKTIGALGIPDTYFFDFLRGVFDGDGSAYSYWDPRWRSSFMYYLTFTSASSAFIEWLRNCIDEHLEIKGHLTTAKNRNVCYQLKYAKIEGLKLARRMYRKAPPSTFLKRKRLKISKMLAIVGEHL